MSTTTVLGVVPDRRPVDLLELRNGHGWSPSIWNRLLRHRGSREHWMFDDPALNQLWMEVEELPEWQQAPLVLTFDTGVVPCTAFAWAAVQLEEFDRRLPAPPGHANHVPAVAELLRSGPEVPLLGVYGTSCSENPFDPWDDEAETEAGGIALNEMYVLERHRADVARMFPAEVALDPRPW